MKRKIIAILLTACMILVFLSGCQSKEAGGGTYEGAKEVTNDYDLVSVEGSEHQFKKYKDMTTEPITLTYLHFDQDETVKALADVFMKIYPNITVNTSYVAVADYQTTLNTMVNNGEAPDLIMFSDADFTLVNSYPMDISAYFNSDEETKALASTVNEAGLGCFGLEGGQRYAVPVKFFPQAIYVDRNVLKTLNLPIPSQNWTWDEMINLIKSATVPQSPDGMAYYGLGGDVRLDSHYGIAAGQQYVGEFGFNGKQFDLSAWAVGEQQYADLNTGGYRAPKPETQANEDWTGEWERWYGSTGHVAVFSESFWTYQNIWNNNGYEEENDLDIVPYVVPAVNEADAGADHHAIATIDFGGVTTTCKYPREAYELLKFMSFGVDGWYARCELYTSGATNAAGIELKHDVMPCPITTDQGVWDAYIAMFCDGLSEEKTEAWKTYFKSAMKPIPFGWTSIAGYWNFCDEYFNKIGIHDKVDAGQIAAADYVDEATRKANWYHAKAMLDYFGPDSYYKVLSEEETAFYTQLMNDNA